MSDPVSEAALWGAYRGPLRVEPCLCGGAIAARENDWDQIAGEVRAHNETPDHRLWAEWAGLRVPGERPTAHELRVDVSPAAQRASAPPLAGGVG